MQARPPSRDSLPDESPRTPRRFDVLDGWRGVSILVVLATHLVPVGPKAWRLNNMTALVGMALFFTLSGFLITKFLLHHASTLDFLIRRLFRIVPIAWIGAIIALVASRSPASVWRPTLLFYANLPPHELPPVGSHLWSLCIEVQFYAGIAVLFALFGKGALRALPALCLLVTAARIATGSEWSGITYLRVDEILAGGVLALAHEGEFGPLPGKVLRRVSPALLAVLLLVSGHPYGGFVNYLRPYLSAMLVGTTLFDGESWLARVMLSPRLKYIGAVSYAVYVDHQLLEFTWLGTGSKIVRYAKRPLLLAASFAIAHLSTYHFENRCIALGKRLSAYLRRPGEARTAPIPRSDTA